MKIKNFSYREHTWQLQGLALSAVNLIVGKNASGKTRTLNTIDSLVKIIAQKEAINWGGE